MSDAESSGEEVFLEPLSGGGGVKTDSNFVLLVGVEGKWVVFSLSAESIPPSFFLLTILETESVSAKGCKEGSVNLQNAIFAGVDVRSRTIPFKWPGLRECHEPFSQQ